MADIIEGTAAEKADEKLDVLRYKIDHNLETQNTRQAMPVVASQAAMLNRKEDYELIENADGSIDYAITMPDGELWGSRLRKSEREQAEEEMSKMLEKMNTPTPE
jgi:hypothetical protein